LSLSFFHDGKEIFSKKPKTLKPVAFPKFSGIYSKKKSEEKIISKGRVVFLEPECKKPVGGEEQK